MDRNLKWQVGQGFKRAGDVEVSKATVERIENIAVSHLAVGNAEDFMLGINALTKLQAKNDNSAVLEALEKSAQVNEAILAKLEANSGI